MWVATRMRPFVFVILHLAICIFAPCRLQSHAARSTGRLEAVWGRRGIADGG